MPARTQNENEYTHRMGKGEIELVNLLIEGAAQLVKWETERSLVDQSIVIDPFTPATPATPATTKSAH